MHQTLPGGAGAFLCDEGQQRKSHGVGQPMTDASSTGANTHTELEPGVDLAQSQHLQSSNKSSANQVLLA